jgi:PD-(D/E)XK nuclease superfamily
MDLKHFFDGQQSRENSASALLATLLAYDAPFRKRFLALEHVEPPGAPPVTDSEVWCVRVEDNRPWTGSRLGTQSAAGSIDISLVSATTVVLIENKLSASAKRYGQLRDYYEAAAAHWSDRRVIALYLGPTIHLGQSEVELVRRSDVFLGRSQPAGFDAVGSLSWTEIRRIVEDSPNGGDWFASTGLAAVKKAIDDAAFILSTVGQRGVVRDAVDAARRSLAGSNPGVRLGPWRGRLYEMIYTAKAPATVFLGTLFDADIDPPYQLVDVVTGSRVRLTVSTSFELSPTGRRSPALVSEWQKLLKRGSVEVGGVGRFTRGDGRAFTHREAFDGTANELVEFIVSRGTATFAFLSPYFALAATLHSDRIPPSL